MGKLNYEKYLDLLEVLDVSIDGKVTYRKNGKTVPTYLNKYGYYAGNVRLNGKIINFNLHTLVATRWIPQPTSLNVEVSHLDQTRTNNHAANLQWVSAKVNGNMPLKKQRQSIGNDPFKKKVAQYDLQGNFIAEFESTCAAARAVNGKQGGISMICTGRKPTYYGYVWKFA